MNNKYIINENTLYLKKNEDSIYIDEINNDDLLTTNNLQKIVEESCLFYGCSYRGRMVGSQSFLHENYKLPILINDSKRLIIFPITSLSTKKRIWFVYNNIENYYQISNHKVLVEFKYGKKSVFHTSYYIFHNQVLKSSQLLVIYNSRNQEFAFK